MSDCVLHQGEPGSRGGRAVTVFCTGGDELVGGPCHHCDLHRDEVVGGPCRDCDLHRDEVVDGPCRDRDLHWDEVVGGVHSGRPHWDEVGGGGEAYTWPDTINVLVGAVRQVVKITVCLALPVMAHGYQIKANGQ